MRVRRHSTTTTSTTTTMASTTSDTASIAEYSDASSLTEIALDELNALREATSVHPSPSSSTQKRKERDFTCTDIWAESKPTPPGKPNRNSHNQLIWYCKQCNWSSTSHNRIRPHLKAHK